MAEKMPLPKNACSSKPKDKKLKKMPSFKFFSSEGKACLWQGQIPHHEQIFTGRTCRW